jgi:hypothetical protein
MYYLAVSFDGMTVAEVFKFAEEWQITDTIWAFQEKCPTLHMAIAYDGEV